MKVEELKKRLKETTFEELIKSEEITVKKYIPIIEKEFICDTVVGMCLTETEGLYEVDVISQRYNTSLEIIRAYTNIELSESFLDSIDEYDYLAENMITETIEDTIKSEYYEICSFIDNILDNKIKIHNSMESIITKFIANLNEKLDVIVKKIPETKNLTDMAKDIAKSVNKIKPEKMEYINKVVDILGSDNIGNNSNS